MIFSEPLADSCIYKVKVIAARGETVSEELIELVRHAQSANRAAIEMLVRHYQMPAVRVAQNILGDLLEAEDAVQDAWLLALRNLAALQNPASFGGWFYRIVANVALRKRQQRNARPRNVDEDGSRLTYGESTWQDVELSLLITPLAGGNAQVLFRVDEARQRFYVLDLMLGWQAATVRRVDQDEAGNLRLVNLSVVNYPFEQQCEYAVMVAARGHSITTYIDGALVNQVTDGAWTQGKVGLTVWKAKTLYRDIQLRLLS